MAKRIDYVDEKGCNKCGEVKPLSEFWLSAHKRKDGTAPYRTYCIPCGIAAKMDRYYNKGGKAEQKKRAFKSLMNKYGITPEIYEQERIKQNYSCKLCGIHESSEKHKRLHVDHCHTTGQYRGLLCGPCNRALGLLKDNTDTLKNAIEYLNENNY
jgi:hypothetical protein